MATLVVLTRKYRYLSSRASSAYAGFSASPKASLDKNVRKKTWDTLSDELLVWTFYMYGRTSEVEHSVYTEICLLPAIVVIITILRQ